MMDLDVLATDDFNRADNADLGANWDVQSGMASMQIVGNAVRPSAVDSDIGEQYNGGISWPDNQWAEVTFKTVPSVGNSGSGAAIRFQAASESGYMTESSSTVTILFQVISNSYVEIGRVVHANTSGDVERIEGRGSTIALFINGGRRLAVGNEAWASGKPGIHMWVQSPGVVGDSEIDAWRGGGFLTTPPLASRHLFTMLVAA